MTALKTGDYYYIGDYKVKQDCIVVKITDCIKNRGIIVYVMVEIVKPSIHPVFRNWSSYAKYGISIPIDPGYFVISKKLTESEALAIKL